jgi:hypothetical protein
MAHRAGHGRTREFDPHQFLGRVVAMEQEVALPNLVHERLIVGFQLLRRHPRLVRFGGADESRNGRERYQQ